MPITVDRRPERTLVPRGQSRVRRGDVRQRMVLLPACSSGAPQCSLVQRDLSVHSGSRVRYALPFDIGRMSNAGSLDAPPVPICAMPALLAADDGGPGAAGADCALGTDCSDCGHRSALSPPPPMPLGCSESCQFSNDQECGMHSRIHVKRPLDAPSAYPCDARRVACGR